MHHLASKREKFIESFVPPLFCIDYYYNLCKVICFHAFFNVMASAEAEAAASAESIYFF